MNAAQLKTMADSLATKAGQALTLATSEAGQWKRVAEAAEALGSFTSTANPNVAGLMLRTARALENVSGTTGAEESMTYDGLMKRIVDALEAKTVVTTGSLYGRAVLASLTATFSANLVVNGDASAGTIAPWSKQVGTASTLTITGGKLRVACIGDTYTTFVQAISTQVGATYNTLADLTIVAAGVFQAVRKADDAGGTTSVVELTTGAGLAQARSFVASATTTYIILQVNNTGAISDFDNISVVKV